MRRMMRLQPRRVKPKIKLDGRRASAYTSRMPSTIDTTGARAESIAHDATLYVWAAVSPDEDAIVRSPKLVISTPAGDVSVQYSTRSGCFSVQALALQIRGLRGATLYVFYDGAKDGAGRGQWPHFGGGYTKRSDDRSCTSAMREAGDSIVRGAMLRARECGAYDRLVRESERIARERRVLEIDAEVRDLAAERAALVAALAAA